MKKMITTTFLVLAILATLFIIVRDVTSSSYLENKGTTDRNDGKERIAIIDSGANISDINYNPKLKIKKYNAIDESTNVSDRNRRGTMIFSSLYNSRSSMQRANEVLVIKAFESDKEIDVYNVVKALKYACDNNSSIINMSFNIAEDKNVTKEIKSCQSKGAVIVATGSSNVNSSLLEYPANLNNVISVGLDSNTYDSTVKVDTSEQQVCVKNKCSTNDNIGLSTAYVTGYLIDYKNKYKASKDLVLKPNFKINRVKKPKE